MSELKDVICYVFVWHTLGSNPCPKCLALNGRQYRGQDLFAPVLVDPEFGPIWDLNADHSLMHGGSGKNCNCFLEVRIENINLEKLPFYPQYQKLLGDLGIYAK